MVARINTPHRLLDALNYNEQKVKKEIAECIHAAGSLQEAGDMRFYDKLELLENRNRLNERATTKTLHVSLNFDASEKMTNEEMTAIANFYMEKLGFGEQPYLVYRHHDAAHPHLHIVASTIQSDGSRINTHNIGRNQSENARKLSEHFFQLVPAKRHKQTRQLEEPFVLAPAQYGIEETRKAITRIITAIIRDYRFTSLPEFNAVLYQFNVRADRGQPNSRLYQSGGLVYRLLDMNGNKIGVPIKASRISGKPILKTLQDLFERNKQLRDACKPALREKLENCKTSSVSSLQDWVQRCRDRNIFVIIRQNETGRAYGITYVDHQLKCVFNGSDLGKAYSLNGILSLPARENITLDTASVAENTLAQHSKELKSEVANMESKLNSLRTSDRLSFEHLPYQFLKTKRRKKKK